MSNSCENDKQAIVSNENPVMKYNIEEDELDLEPFDERFFITEDNKLDMIKYFEKEIRDSFEYKSLISTYKTVLDVKSCVFFKGYSVDNGMSLEFHHHPFTLYDYTEAVLNRFLDINDGFVLENEVEKEVVMLHYKLMVGLVPLDPTSHGQVHDKLLDIPPQLVIGDYEKFYNEYNKWIPNNTQIKYLDYLEKYKDNKDIDDLEYPENFKYKPSIINADNKRLITIPKIDTLLISNKINDVNNETIAKLLNKK